MFISVGISLLVSNCIKYSYLSNKSFPIEVSEGRTLKYAIVTPLIVINIKKQIY